MGFMDIQLKYGKEIQKINLDDSLDIEIIYPNFINTTPLESFDIDISKIDYVLHTKNKSCKNLKVGIAINDKTRPIPYPILIPMLLDKLLELGIDKGNISFFISNGTHVPDFDLSYLNVSPDILSTYNFFQHDSRNQNNLVNLGFTTLKTPVFINKLFFEKDLKISIGNIEPHHFAGYSGGAKTVAIGLAGHETITHNHKLLLDPKSIACEYNLNLVRQDVEEIGVLSGLDLSLNCVQTSDLKILKLYLDSPKNVMLQAIPYINQIYTVNVEEKYDIVIASAGGFPKDINFYQSQKAYSNAGKIVKNNGKILLYAECKEGIGSSQYHNYVKNFASPVEVLQNFSKTPFVIGNHKAFLMARMQEYCELFLHSRMNQEIVSQIMVTPVSNFSKFLSENNGFKDLKIAIMPNAVTTIPILKENDYGRNHPKF